MCESGYCFHIDFHISLGGTTLADRTIFGNPDNDPRMFGRYILSNKSETKMKKSTFTTCKNVPGKCPSWSISADEIIHKNEKKCSPVTFLDH